MLLKNKGRSFFASTDLVVLQTLKYFNYLIKIMRTSLAILVIGLLVCCFGLRLHKDQVNTLYQGRVSLQADTGKYLARCYKCANYYRFLFNDSAIPYADSNEIQPAIWDLIKVGDKVALKADNYKYLAVCRRCWRDQHFNQSVFVEVESLDGHPQALWTPEYLGNGKWAFKSYQGKYLTRCNKCSDSSYSDVAFAHVDDANGPWAQWKLSYLFPPRDINIQGYNGAYLSRCTKCGNGQHDDSVSLQFLSPDDSRAIWYAEPSGGYKFGLLDENQNYMSRCPNCWNGVNLDGVFDYLETTTSNIPQINWTPVWIQGNKWAFKSDNGKYLTICSDCIPGGQFAFVSSDSPTDPKAQFTVTSRIDYRV